MSEELSEERTDKYYRELLSKLDPILQEWIDAKVFDRSLPEEEAQDAIQAAVYATMKWSANLHAFFEGSSDDFYVMAMAMLVQAREVRKEMDDEEQQSTDEPVSV